MSKTIRENSRQVYRHARHIYHKALFPNDDAAWAAKMWQEEDRNVKSIMRTIACWHLKEIATQIERVVKGINCQITEAKKKDAKFLAACRSVLTQTAQDISNAGKRAEAAHD